eukprot:3960662-Amphidinium_carterae.1
MFQSLTPHDLPVEYLTYAGTTSLDKAHLHPWQVSVKAFPEVHCNMDKGNIENDRPRQVGC